MRATRTLPLALTMTFALTACGGSALSGGGGDEGGDDDKVKIALLVPQSGVYAPLGKDMEAGFRLYLDENDNKLGGKEVELTVVDEGSGPEDGVPAGTKLAQDESVDAVVGIVNSAVALGLTDSFTEAKKPLIITNAGANDITGKSSSPYVWRTSFSNGEVSEAIGAHVAKEVGDGKVYLVGPDYAAGQEFLASFKKSFEGAGGKVAGTQMTPFGKTTNFQPYLQKVRNAKPKAVFAFYAGARRSPSSSSTTSSVCTRTSPSTPPASSPRAAPSRRRASPRRASSPRCTTPRSWTTRRTRPSSRPTPPPTRCRRRSTRCRRTTPAPSWTRRSTRHQRRPDRRGPEGDR